MANVYEPSWDAEQDRSPFTWRRARLGRQAGGEKLGASLYELPPGASSFPFHLHHANEEMIVVISGRPSLTRADGEIRGLEPGDVVAGPAGREGAHRLDNHSDEPARVLIVSTMRAPEINEMLEDGTFWVRDYAPGLTPEDPSLDVPGLRRSD